MSEIDLNPFFEKEAKRRAKITHPIASVTEGDGWHSDQMYLKLACKPCGKHVAVLIPEGRKATESDVRPLLRLAYAKLASERCQHATQRPPPPPPMRPPDPPPTNPTG